MQQMNDMFPSSPNEVSAKKKKKKKKPSPNEVGCDQVNFTRFGLASSACGAKYCTFSHRRVA